jgi:D-lactate dehydrogenase
MKIIFFSSKPYDREYFERANARFGHELNFVKSHLDVETAPLATGWPVVCAFVNDSLDARVLKTLRAGGTRLIALRSAGFNNVDLAAARELGLRVVRVPAYSPYAVAEHAIALILALNRKIYRAHNRVREGNFSLDGLLGFDLHGKTVGVVGTGTIGELTAKILQGFGCQVLAYDVKPNERCRTAGASYVSLDELFARSDVITFHCPLVAGKHHLIDAAAVAKMKPGVMIVNTGRGALIDTNAIIAGLKSGRIGYLGLDVYEEEGDLFFEDRSNAIIGDDVFSRLQTFPNVLITGHQAFFTREALAQIAETTLSNVTEFGSGAGPQKPVLTNEVANAG